MANKKITEMASLLAANTATNDVIPIVDVSETDPNKNKKIAISELLELFDAANDESIAFPTSLPYTVADGKTVVVVTTSGTVTFVPPKILLRFVVCVPEFKLELDVLAITDSPVPAPFPNSSPNEVGAFHQSVPSDT